MNKKFLSAILFGALMVTSTGTFVSCKDYDDDIDSLNEKVDKLTKDLSELQAAAGKYVTAVKYDAATDRKSTRLNSSHRSLSRMPSSA